MSHNPTVDDLHRLRERHALATAAVGQTQWVGGGPVYPREINDLMGALGREPWGGLQYDHTRSQAILDNLSSATMEDIRSLFTHIVRSERFSLGAWHGVIGGDIPWDAVFERLEALVDPQGRT